VNEKQNFPDWDDLYKKQSVETMPWYNDSLDLDLERELNSLNLQKGKFLDLGTGPATQAKRLFERGFDVTASDISETAIRLASHRFNKDSDKKINFVVDDILKTKFKESEFNYIFDRGCFHVLPMSSRIHYVAQIKKILIENGIFFLKCFSDKEPPRNPGPYRFSADQIKDLFEREDFIIQNIRDTVYQGTLNPLPKALFIVMRKKSKL
jgi:SAM-dependent methyltransferase